MPDDEDNASLIQKFMLHHHPSPDQPKSSYCQSIVDGEQHCRFHYPHPITDRTTVDAQGQVHYHHQKEQD